MQPVFDTKEEEEHFYRKQKEDERLKPCSKVRTDNKKRVGASQAANFTIASPNGPIGALVNKLPEGWNDDKRENINAGELLTLLQEAGFTERFRLNLLTLEVELDGVELNPIQAETAYVHIQQIGWNVSQQAVIDALRTIAERNSFNPIKDYFATLRDVQPVDITRLASKYFRPSELKGEQTIYDRMMLKTLVAAVGRIMNPGMKHDTCTVLEGGQGLKKTTFWNVLFGEFFTVFRHNINDKDALLSVHQHWALELGELDNITSSFKAGALKNFLSTREDSFRTPYGRKIAKSPRPSIFVGSCNRRDFLHDDTGERRFWIIPLALPAGQKINIDDLSKQRDGIWKAAVDLYQEGSTTFLDHEDDQLNDELNKDFSSDSIVETPVSRYLERSGKPEYLSPHEVYKFVAEELGQTVNNRIQAEVKGEMARRGWTLVRTRDEKYGPSRPRMFKRP